MTSTTISRVVTCRVGALVSEAVPGKGRTLVLGKASAGAVLADCAVPATKDNSPIVRLTAMRTVLLSRIVLYSPVRALLFQLQSCM